MRQYQIRLAVNKVALLLVVLALVVGCGATAQTKVTKVYVANVQTINAVHDAIANACTQGLLNPTQCTTIQADYNKAATAYKAAGDVLMQINIASEQLDQAKAAVAAANTDANATALAKASVALSVLTDKYPAMLQTATDLITAVINTLAAIGVNIQ